MPCAVPCEINPCSERCQKILDCGHQCPSPCGERCPSSRFCQVCGSDEVTSREVDLITFEPYSDIDLDINPIIVPTCGHFYTVETYDSHMGMKNCYILDENNGILGPRPLASIRSPDATADDQPERPVVKNCPDCRAPLRDMQRYNRIVKTAFLDESTRRFCANAQAKFLVMYQEVSLALEIMQANRGDFIAGLRTTVRPTNPLVPGRPPVSEADIPQAISDRKRKGMQLRMNIKGFINTVSEEEQPYSKVRQMVLSARRRRGIESAFVGDPSAVQLGFRLKSQNLLLEATWEALWDLHLILASSVVDPAPARVLRNGVLNNLKRQHQRCAGIITDCRTTSFGKYEVEARIRSAQFFALYRLEFFTMKLSANAAPATTQTDVGAPDEHDWLGPDLGETIRKAESKSLDQCDKLCDALPGTVGPLKDQVKQARDLLGGATIYTTVSAEEKRLIYEAMSVEFTSTGRWYTCQNGHQVNASVGSGTSGC